MRAGARGYLLKGVEGEETIRTVAGGDASFSPKAAERLIKHFAAASQDAVTPALPDLTPRRDGDPGPDGPATEQYRHRRAAALEPQDDAQPGFDGRWQVADCQQRRGHRQGAGGRAGLAVRDGFMERPRSATEPRNRWTPQGRPRLPRRSTISATALAEGSTRENDWPQQASRQRGRQR